jgi:tRNA A37 methylthiotransferase MiaB
MVKDVQRNGVNFSCKGRADDHTLVHFTAENAQALGEIAQVRITAAKTFYVSGIAVRA